MQAEYQITNQQGFTLTVSAASRNPYSTGCKLGMFAAASSVCMRVYDGKGWGNWGLIASFFPKGGSRHPAR